MLTLQVEWLSERGGRSYNEDACGHWRSAQQLCAVLADGAGGHGGGDIASRVVVQELIGRFAAEPSAHGAQLGELLRATNEALIRHRIPGTARQDMHSTVVGLVIDFVGHRAHWAHAGDSRMYWFRDGHVLDRTRDHSLVQSLVDAGMLSTEQMRGHPKRSELRSALGIGPDVLEVSAADGGEPVRAGDVFLLCTDGLWEYLDDGILEATLAAATTPRAWLDALSGEVAKATREKAGHDNFTALVVWASEA